MHDTPVAFCVFNRPELTRRTFAAIRARRPGRMFIIADGPRPGHATDAERCRQVRDLVAAIDWPCDVERNYAEHNLGLKARVTSGLDWVFARVEQAIVLEDDCLPHPDFFRFCDDLLIRYADDHRVWAVTGSNFQAGRRRGSAAYYFSKFNHVWGWATWRRAWQHNQGDMAFWPQWRSSADWVALAPDASERRYWEDIFEKVFRGEIDSWAYPWTACVWRNRGLTATPNVNLISNIGLGPDSTHTTDADRNLARPTAPLGDLRHPRRVIQDLRADRFTFRHVFRQRPAPAFPRVRSLAQSIVRRICRTLRARSSL